MKIVQSLLPSQSGVLETPRQPPRSTAPAAPAPRDPAPRMSEPTPIETDDEDWYWDGEDLVRYDEAPTNPSKPRNKDKGSDDERSDDK